MSPESKFGYPRKRALVAAAAIALGAATAGGGMTMVPTDSESVVYHQGDSITASLGSLEKIPEQMRPASVTESITLLEGELESIIASPEYQQQKADRNNGFLVIVGGALAVAVGAVSELKLNKTYFKNRRIKKLDNQRKALTTEIERRTPTR